MRRLAVLSLDIAFSFLRITITARLVYAHQLSK